MSRATAESLVEALMIAIEADETLAGSTEEIASTKTFREAGLLTSNEGLVVRLANGQTFQITIVEGGK